MLEHGTLFVKRVVYSPVYAPTNSGTSASLNSANAMGRSKKSLTGSGGSIGEPARYPRMSFFAGGVRLDRLAIHIANRLCIRFAKRRLVGIGPDQRVDGEAVVVEQAFRGLAEERGVSSFPRIRAPSAASISASVSASAPLASASSATWRHAGEEAKLLPSPRPISRSRAAMESSPCYGLGTKAISSISAGSSDAGDSGLLSTRARARWSFSMMKRL